MVYNNKIYTRGAEKSILQKIMLTKRKEIFAKLESLVDFSSLEKFWTLAQRLTKICRAVIFLNRFTRSRNA
jgi:hypothetical protein